MRIKEIGSDFILLSISLIIVITLVFVGTYSDRMSGDVASTVKMSERKNMTTSAKAMPDPLQRVYSLLIPEGQIANNKAVKLEIRLQKAPAE